MRLLIRRLTYGLGLVLILSINGGCGQKMVSGLVAVPFNVAKHVVVETAKVPIEAAHMGANGVVSAVVK